MSSESIDLTGASPPTGIPPPLVKVEQALLPATIPQEQTLEQNPYFLYQKECRIAWIKYLGLLGRAIENFTKDRDIIKRWEALGSRNSMHLLNPAQASPEQATAYKEIQPSMLRLVGIQKNEEDPASSPGYVLSMASFERSVWKGEKASNEIERRQCADMALRSLQKFMDAQKNEAVIDKMVGFQKHYEALAAFGLK
ncbi:hypothetical protein FMEXI_8746 [Fusarium mexicanum]|uniref:Uncharacterized protein n=1 Tax=Fusarium mexicanum TaxID=751941 RepID=A0A8H5MT76_9HYPO|nr:hypothetical protein FMEXI_8746 [Fusarium mexicanum]